MEIPLDQNENDESLYKKEVTDKEIETMGQCKIKKIIHLHIKNTTRPSLVKIVKIL
jgi:hypothetical protein